MQKPIRSLSRFIFIKGSQNTNKIMFSVFGRLQKTLGSMEDKQYAEKPKQNHPLVNVFSLSEQVSMHKIINMVSG